MKPKINWNMNTPIHSDRVSENETTAICIDVGGFEYVAWVTYDFFHGIDSYIPYESETPEIELKSIVVDLGQSECDCTHWLDFADLYDHIETTLWKTLEYNWEQQK